MKYLSIIVVAALALVSCGGELDACGCIEKGTEMINSAESLEELSSIDATLTEDHPECADAPDSDLEACPEAVEEMMAAAMKKGMELGGM